MKRVTGRTEFAWIGDALGNRSQEDAAERPALTVGRFLPPVFEAYCKLLHPIYVDPDVSSGDITWDDAEGRQSDSEIERLLGASLASLGVTKSVLVIGHHEVPEGSPRVRWGELAKRWHVPVGPGLSFAALRRGFGRESWPRQFLGPRQGSLDRPTCESLVRLLRPWTARSERVYFWYSWANTAHSAGRFDVGWLDDLPRYFSNDDVSGSPEYWWPEGPSWCVFTDCDFAFTLVGGSHGLVDALLGDAEVECVPVASNDLLI